MIAATQPASRIRLRVPAVAVRPVLFFACLATLFFFRLGHRDLYSSHEARAAQNAQRMLDTGEWAIPTLFDGQIDLQKPPGYYWLVAAAGWVNGGVVTEFETRLPAALAGLLTVLMVFAFLRSEGRPTAAWIAAASLATSVHFTAISRTARIDVPLTCAVTAGLLLMHRRSWLAAFPIAAGVLLKGPIAVALIGPVGVILFWKSSSRTDGRRWTLPFAMVLGVVLSLPWFLWADRITQGEFYRVFIVHHHVERFAGTSPTLASHPWWYYVPRFAVDFLPWTPALLLAARRASKGLDSHARFGLIWFSSMFVVLSTAHFKRADYLLPLYPGAAIALGCLAESWLRSRKADRPNVVRHSVAGGVGDDSRSCATFEKVSVQAACASLNASDRPRHGVADYVPNTIFAILGLALAGWLVMSFVVEPREQAREEKRRFAEMIREVAPSPNEVLLFRTEPHLLAWHLGRPIRSRVEWHDLREFCDPPGTRYIVMPPEYVAFAQHIVTSRKLVEAARLDEYTADKPSRPLVLLRTEPSP